VPNVNDLDQQVNYQLDILLIIFQLLVNLLDLIGVVLIAGLGALLIQGVDSNKPGNKVGKLLDILHLRQNNFENQIVTLDS
jgi:hypothetical protein